MSRAKLSKQGSYFREFNDLIRGMSGGFLFGIPLLYTMEVWWIGSSAHPPRLLVALVMTFGIVLLLNQTAGFRRGGTGQLREAIFDSVEAMAIGLVCATCTLGLLKEITLETPLPEALGKLIFEAVPFALGVALANQFLTGDRSESESQGQTSSKPQKTRSEINATFADVGATLIGSTIIAFNIAPTDEIPLLAVSISGPWLLAVMAVSLIISYLIVFVANFSDQQKRQRQQGIFQRPFSETIMSYLVSLIAAAGMLWFFDRLNGTDPWSLWLSYTLILGLPATIGGAAGRLAV